MNHTLENSSSIERNQSLSPIARDGGSMGDMGNWTYRQRCAELTARQSHHIQHQSMPCRWLGSLDGILANCLPAIVGGLRLLTGRPGLSRLGLSTQPNLLSSHFESRELNMMKGKK